MYSIILYMYNYISCSGSVLERAYEYICTNTRMSINQQIVKL